MIFRIDSDVPFIDRGELKVLIKVLVSVPRSRECSHDRKYETTIL